MRYILIFCSALAIAAAFVGLVGWTTMSLWNWLMPPIFGLCLISFWQALGLLALSRILCGGFGGHRGGGGGVGFWQHKKQHWKQKMKDKWECMSEEERADWRSKFDRHCGK
jgi:hypothetical protein